MCSVRRRKRQLATLCAPSADGSGSWPFMCSVRRRKRQFRAPFGLRCPDADMTYASEAVGGWASLLSSVTVSVSFSSNRCAPWST